MDSAELLDLLGNENRRRILRLLSRKPCYVTEIGEYLDLSPKAVIDHLERLEQAGIVESRTDGSRRKYFHITQDVRLEVTVSRHEYGTKSAYPANPGMDIRGRTAHVRLDIDDETLGDNTAADGGSAGDVATLASEYGRLREVENELSLAQRWVRGRIADVLDKLQSAAGTESDAQFHAELLAAVTTTDGTEERIVADVDAPPREARRGLRRLADAGLLERDGGRWRVVGEESSE